MYVIEKHQPNQKPDNFHFNHLNLLLKRISNFNKVTLY